MNKIQSLKDEKLYTEGIFKHELKNRFLCIINVNGEDIECYIPSSCRLSNFIQLTGKKTLLKENINKNARTKYSVFAVKHKRNYIILNTSMANNLIAQDIRKSRFSFLGKRKEVLQEKLVSDYKCDIYIPDTNTIIEIKSIISDEDFAEFPTVYSERAINQLKKILALLESGYKVCYMFVSLNPYIKEISISKNKKANEFRDLFIKCINKGMLYKAYSVHFRNNILGIRREIDKILL